MRGDAPKGLLDRSPSGLPKNFQRIFSWCEHSALIIEKAETERTEKMELKGLKALFLGDSITE